jgi:chromate transporter
VTAVETASVSFRDAFRFWLKLGFINFGGPSGQIAIMHQELVEKRRWIDEERFLHALNYCMLLPGPEAQQLATYVGWLLHGTRGGLVAGTFFVLPGFFLLLALSWLYAAHGRLAPVAAVFSGLRAAVIAIVAAALLRLGARALRGRAAFLIAAAAFVAIFALAVPFPAIVLGAGLLGLALERARPGALAGANAASASARGGALAAAPAHAGRRAVRVLAVGLAAWWLPLLLVIAIRGRQDVLSQEAVYFSQAAMVTFGGAYAVLAYVNQAAVGHFGWLLPGQMLDGLALAETTPGPLILVLEFVGFVAAWRNPGGLDPLLAGVLGATVTVWATFAPCFLWIFLGAPFIERLRGNRALAAALSGITAAVVGVMLNLAVWFALHALFGTVKEVALLGLTLPVVRPKDLDLPTLALTVVCFVAQWRFSWGLVPVIAGSAAAGLLRALLAR